MSKKDMSARFASSKGKKSKKKPQVLRNIPSRVDSQVEAAPTISPDPRPTLAPPSVARKAGLRSWIPPKTGRGQAGLSTDYGYVSSDLKRIAVTSAVMFAIIVVLSFVIR